MQAWPCAGQQLGWEGMEVSRLGPPLLVRDQDRHLSGGVPWDSEASPWLRVWLSPPCLCLPPPTPTTTNSFSSTFKTQRLIISFRTPREGNGNPIQYSCLDNSMDRGTW